jgi:hypothetical protein
VLVELLHDRARPILGRNIHGIAGYRHLNQSPFLCRL